MSCRRAPLLRDYDALAKAVQAMEDAIDRLRSRARAEGLDPAAVDRLAATAAQQEELTERFKTAMRSCRTPCPMSASRAPAAYLARGMRSSFPQPARWRRPPSSHARYSPEAVAALQERIDGFAARAPANGPDADAPRHCSHMPVCCMTCCGRRRHAQGSRRGTSSPPLEEIGRCSPTAKPRRSDARRFQVLLYMVSLCCSSCWCVSAYDCGLVPWRCDSGRNRACHRREFDTLINCPPSETDSRLRQVLGELCRAIARNAAMWCWMRVHPTNTWCAEGTAYPPAGPIRRSSCPHSSALPAPTSSSSRMSPPCRVRLQGRARGGRRPRLGLRALIRQAGCGNLGFDALHPSQLKPAGWSFPPAGGAVGWRCGREPIEREFSSATARGSRRARACARMQMVGSLASGIAHNFTT